MAKPKTDSERRYDAAKSNLVAAEQAVREAEKITTGHPSKIEAKRRSLGNLENTMSHADADQNSRANRGVKKSDIANDLAKLERELSEATTTLNNARGTAQTARQEEARAAAAFSVEADRAVMNDSAQRTKLAVQGHELAERKFALSEKANFNAVGRA